MHRLVISPAGRIDRAIQRHPEISLIAAATKV
jgi:hypothetical protein